MEGRSPAGQAWLLPAFPPYEVGTRANGHPQIGAAASEGSASKGAVLFGGGAIY